LFASGEHFQSDNWRGEKPGTFFTYTNAGFGLLGTLVEKLSGRRFDEYMKSEVLDPLGIVGSYNVADVENIDDVAVLYRNLDDGWTPQADNFQGVKPEPANLDGYVPGTNGLLFGPQGSLRVSVLDLAKIMRVHSEMTPLTMDRSMITFTCEPS
jgi:CubicO group peptidase (beta-lactamase class C family)